MKCPRAVAHSSPHSLTRQLALSAAPCVAVPSSAALVFVAMVRALRLCPSPLFVRSLTRRRSSDCSAGALVACSKPTSARIPCRSLTRCARRAVPVHSGLTVRVASALQPDLENGDKGTLGSRGRLARTRAPVRSCHEPPRVY